MGFEIMTKTLAGLVVRIVNISPSGGAIFRLLPEDTAKSVRVVASGKAVPVAPAIGDSLVVHGDYANDRTYGYQFKATASAFLIPTGRNIVKFLASNPRFSWLGRPTVNRLWSSLGERLQVCLTSSEIGELARAGKISAADALRLIRSWRSHVQESEAAAFFVGRGLPVSAVPKALELWGDKTLAQVATNPYSLAAFTPWTEIDKVCTEQLGVSFEDEIRLVSACKSCMEDYVHRGRSMGISKSVLIQKLRARLGKVAFARESVRLAGERGVFSSCLSSGVLLQPPGIRMLEQAFRERVGLGQRSPSTTGPSVGTNALPAPVSPAPAAAEHPVFSFLPVDSNASYDWADLDSARVHAFPSASMRAHFAAADVRTVLYSELVSGAYPRSGLSELVLFGAETMDIAMATALLYAIPRNAAVIVVSPRSVRGSDESFWFFLQSLDGERDQCARDVADVSTADDVIANSLGTKKISVQTDSEANELALALFREADETSTALLVATQSQDAKVLNDILHAEFVDLRQAMNLPTTFFQICERKQATVGTRVVARSDVMGKQIRAGAVGVVTKMLFASATPDEVGSKVDLQLALIDFDTAGLVSLSTSECTALDFGYAIPLSLDRWSAVAHRIFLSRAAIDATLLCSSIARTKQSVVFIEHGLAQPSTKL